MAGALDGVRVVEVAAIGPAPYGVMLLADLGADVVRVDRVGGGAAPATMQGLSRNRRSVALDLKDPEGVELLLRLVDDADVLVEGFRPGVAERLGFGPDTCRARNEQLVYGRMTGWGQDGPRAHTAGHDLTYAAVAGAIHPIGDADRPPPPPLNLVADFGGGGAFLALGVMAALLERERSGHGQVVDAAMVDGVASLTSFFHGLLREGAWTTERSSNLLDGGAPFYATYRCADGEHIAVGALEPQFYAALLDGLGIDPDEVGHQHDRSRWPALRERIAGVVATRTRDEWDEAFADTDACVAPVLRLDEAPDAPHLQARGSFVEHDGTVEPAPAPRLSRTPGSVRLPAPGTGAHTDEVLDELGLDAAGVASLRERGVVG